MAKKESTQKRIGRDRAPRVQINYDVEIGDAIETKELPFVLGVMADFSGHPKVPLPRMKDRKFILADSENLDDVVKGIAPRLALRVSNELKKDGSELGVEINFRKMEDFEPAQIVNQVEPLRRLMAARTRLADLRGKLAGNDKLEQMLEQVIHDTEKLRSIPLPQAETEE
jgi:type VI secretion system protein ImpB